MLTSAYSGLGTFELIAREVVEEFGKALGVVPSVTCYSACEVDEVARKALHSHGAETKPRHIFRDVFASVVLA